MTVQGIVSGYTEENPQIVYEYACGEIRGAEQLLTVALNLTVNQPPTITAENITVTVEKEVDTNHPGNEQKPSDDGKTDKGQHKSF